MDTKQTITLTLIAEEKPYLVAGMSARNDQPVFGFPYILKKRVAQGRVLMCRCIILPASYDEKDIADGDCYDLACLSGEFHPITGDYSKFLYEDGDGRYHFENGIVINT